jgi:hypothetical protein
MNLAPKELKQLVHDGMQAADSLIHSGNQQQQSRGLADSPAWRNLKVGLEKAGLIPLDQPPARPGAAGGDPSARPVRGDPPPRPGQEQRDSPEQARAQGDSPERQGGALDRQAAWGKLADKWDLSGEWAKFKQVPAEELGQVVNKGIQDAATARNMQALQEWSNFRRDLIDAGLMRDDKPRSPVKEKKIEGPVMGF